MGSIGGVSSTQVNTSISNLNVGNTVSVIHYTNEKNIQSLLNSEFDMSRSGESAGDVWGAGAYYLEKGSYEDDMYSARLYTESYIQSDIDTSGFLIVDTLSDTAYSSSSKMYEDAAKSFNKSIHRNYTSLLNRLRREGQSLTDARKNAFKEVAKQYYDGLIIKHRVNGGRYIDPLSGGNQIVVYNQSAIKNKKAGRNRFVKE